MLFSTITLAQPQEWFHSPGNNIPPESWYTPYRTSIGKSISTPTTPYYLRHKMLWPAFLVQSQDLNVANNITRAIIRIQDKRYNISANQNELWAGEPQIQFWSGEYHTQNEWWMGSIQGIADLTNQDTDIFLGKPNVAGGLAFYSRKKDLLINQGIDSPVETMRILDDKVTIGAKQTENKFAVVPYWNYDLTNQFAIDHRESTTHALLTKFYKSTGSVDGNGKRTSFSWHIEFPNLNVDQEWETLGAFNFCSDNNSLVPGEEGENLTRLVTFLRTGKVGIKNENPKGELDIDFSESQHLTRAIFKTNSDNPSIRLYRDFSGGNPMAHSWWIENHREPSSNNSSLMFRNNSAVPAPQIGFETSSALFTMSDIGNFGIGTETPDNKLHVVGNSHIEGNLGIKTSDPRVELHVLGQVSINDPFTNKTLTGNHDDYMLAVEGKIVAKEIIVTIDNWNSWPDYVFKSGYKLMPLTEVEESIKLNGHLPGVPSALEIKENGLNISEVQAKMLEKIEELTLYMIELKKENEILKQEINKLK